MSEFTNVLHKSQDGDQRATAELHRLVYDELRKLAAVWMARERPDHTLQATDLLHEAWMRLGDGTSSPAWESRAHFFSAAAQAMRRILIDHARRRARPKHGGDRQRVPITDSMWMVQSVPMDDVLALDEALKKLEAKDARKAELVKLRVFAGMTGRQAAEVLKISASTADLDWAYAKTWLRLEIEGQSADSNAAN